MNDESTAAGAPLRPHLKTMFRLQWEPMHDACMLVHPEGRVTLNPSAGQILERCDGTRDLDEIIAELEALFCSAELATDVYRFLDDARQRGWLD
ncbi:pyrroloquinoline quinone biosynthesis peptide chaperone PqqD [Trinickia caryophylli]|uniref:Pyrroloquinoline quinone biosynthesis protein D n=1 Tax=Trinickia caryophylli TaxID=28094 RepID=A0A1X7CGP9_TRICW|nr:pyrroloquinoline quinone biosynthesis peptide chaperone PqqD [Trinickia caryophylli]PMS11579.1 pyrroloquinoline quinone biosynthesis peptide chaperone PqqD [Trinickia caryophylli]TRX19867.1 pyrroloquinoline quinone biosynthesis peptide chaperone PqqD [Trinickia caryophylli]WQE12799.1 pyrroloquinoline quinone biosynthesis peptide chaperone PqqD [Trinickia caryophylli]SME96300.1 pyrroloquinoline quinone biosynthesis protein D [Trinickia caryophylli]GLU30515.1 coenzyme PQQ synthesis protein D 